MTYPKITVETVMKDGRICVVEITRDGIAWMTYLRNLILEFPL